MGRLIRTDYHVHTNHSLCGSPEATPWAMVRAAQAASLEAIAITDHVVAPINFDRPRLVREELPLEVDGLRVYVGCEAEMHARDLPSISREYAAGLDLVLFSPSHLHNIDPRLVHGLERPEMAALILELMKGAIETGYADIIGHAFHVPTCRHSFGQIVAAAEEAELNATLEMAAQAGVAMECNPQFLRADPEAATWLFRLFLECGCKVTISSDSHHPAGVGCRGPQFATEEELRAVGISEEHLFRIEERVTRALR